MYVDKRIERTYNDLQKGMRALLGTHSWDEITVNALCKKSGVSRSTFYIHFKHKDDLLDSLLLQFEQAMRMTNNGRSIRDTGTFKFLPILLIHVMDNRDLFAKNNTSVGGYPVAIRFHNLITRLVKFELETSFETNPPSADTIQYLSGGIYAALVGWSVNTDDALHLDFLQRLDELNKKLLADWHT